MIKLLEIVLEETLSLPVVIFFHYSTYSTSKKRSEPIEKRFRRATEINILMKSSQEHTSAPKSDSSGLQFGPQIGDK